MGTHLESLAQRNSKKNDFSLSLKGSNTEKIGIEIRSVSVSVSAQCPLFSVIGIGIDNPAEYAPVFLDFRLFCVVAKSGKVQNQNAVVA